MQCVLVLDARRDRLANKAALMELLTVPQHVGDERDADRAAGIARRVEQCRGLVGLMVREPIIRGCEDRDEDQWPMEAGPPSLTLRRVSARGTAASEISISTQKASM